MSQSIKQGIEQVETIGTDVKEMPLLGERKRGEDKKV